MKFGVMASALLPCFLPCPALPSKVSWVNASQNEKSAPVNDKSAIIDISIFGCAGKI
jgi:hypothetical protein